MVAAPLGAPSAAPAQESWEDAVRALLERRAAAVMARDREAFMATLDPRAHPKFEEGQATLFEGLASVPFASYRLVLRTEDVHDVSLAVTGRRKGADEIRLPAVEEHVEIAGVDAKAFVGDLWLTFVRRGRDWYVNADTDLADLGLETQRSLWDFGPVAFTEGRRVTVMSAPESRDRADALLRIAEEGFDGLRESLPWEAPPKVLLVLPGSLSQLESMLQTNFDLTNFVAFATADVDRSEEAKGWRWTSPRVFAQETNLGRHSRTFQVETLHHELVHVVAFEKAGPFIPNWLHEGHADWLALGRGRPQSVPSSDAVLPLDHEFVTGGGDAILRAYRESTSAIAFLAQERGLDAPSRFFASLGRVRIAPGTWRYHLDQVMQDVYGAGFERFQEDWNGG